MRPFFIFLLLSTAVLNLSCKFNGVTVSQDPTDFGYVWIGQRAMKSVGWNNATNGPVTLDLTQALQPPFGYKPLTGTHIPLQPGGGYWADIIAAPYEVGLSTDELTASNLGGINIQPTTLQVTGLGMMVKGCLTLSGGYINALTTPAPGQGGSTGPTGSPNAGPMDFGDILINTHAEKTITLNNSGAGAVNLNISLISVSTQAFSASMSTSGTPLKSLKLAGNSSTTIVLSFTPGYAGPFYSVLQIYDSAKFVSSANAAGLVLTGKGHKPVE